MGFEVNVYPRPAVDADDVTATLLVPFGTTNNKLVFNKNAAAFIRTRTGKRARLVFVGNAVDPGGETEITFHVLVNGARLIYPYDSFQQALGATYDSMAQTAVPVELPQNAMIEVAADNDSSDTDYNAFIRMRIIYEDF